MCGTRDAAAAFDRFATEVMASQNYEAGRSTPCVLAHGKEPLFGWRHGDDIILAGEVHFLDHVVKDLAGYGE